MAKHYRAIAEVCIDGGSPMIEQGSEDYYYGYSYSPQAKFIAASLSDTPTPTQVVEAVPFSQLRCFGCGHIIDDMPFISVLNGVFHDNCFRCDACKTILEISNYQVVNGKPHCDPPCPMQTNNQILVASTAVLKTSMISETSNPELGDKSSYPTIIMETGNAENVQNITREFCFVCRRVIDNNMFVRALDGIFHNDCFRCHKCNRLLRVGNCKFVDDNLLCEPDCEDPTETTTSVECSTTVLPLGERSEKTIPMTRYHFTMEYDREATPQNVHANSPERLVVKTIDSPKNSDEDSFNVTCFACHTTVLPADRVETVNRVYHKACFNCFKCHRRLSEHKFNITEENPCCQPYCGYNEREEEQAMYIGSAFEAIPSTMTYQQAMIKDASPNQRITLPLSSPAPENSNQLYLYQGRSDAAEHEWKDQQLRSPSQPENLYCYSCSKKVYAAERLNALNRVYHKSCFRCLACNNVLNIGRYSAFEGNPYCEPHQRQLKNLRGVSAYNLRSEYSDKDSDHIYEELKLENNTPAIKPRRHTRDNFTLPTNADKSDLLYPLADEQTQVNEIKPFPTVSMEKKHSSMPHLDQVSDITQSADVKRQREHFMPSNSDIAVDRIKPVQRTFIDETVYEEPMVKPTGLNDGQLPPAPRVVEERAKSVNPADITVSYIYCFACKDKVYPKERLFMLDRWYHRTCFRCKACNNVLNIGRYSVHEDDPYCIPHHKQRMYLSNTSLHNLQNELAEEEFNQKAKTHSETFIYKSARETKQTKSEPSTPMFSHRPRVPTVVQQPFVLESQPVPRVQQVPPPRPIDPDATHSQRSMLGQPETHEEIYRSPSTITHLDSLEKLAKSIRDRELSEQTCHRCKMPVGDEERVVFNGQLFHAKCFACRICRISLGSKNCKELNGRLFCDLHYSQKLASIKQSQRERFASSPSTPRASNYRVSTETLNALHQVALAKEPRVMGNQTQADIITPTNENTALQAQHEQLVERLNLLNGNGPADHLVCANCHKSVQPTMFLKLQNKYYHFGCIRCQVCERKLNRWNYKEVNGSIFCPKHYPTGGVAENRSRPNSVTSSRASTPRRNYSDKIRCFICGDRVYATEQLNVMDRTYHRGCFKCLRCHNTLGVENYYVHEGAPYCKAHYGQVLRASNLAPESTDTSVPMVFAELEQNLCHGCQLPVHPREGMHALERFYHYGCFKCADCQQVLNMGKYEVALGQPYCEVDFIKNYGKNPITSSKTPAPRHTAPVG